MVNRKRREAGKQWTRKELDAYNIRINTVDAKAFFGSSDLPAPLVSPESIILNHVNPPNDLQLSRDENRFFTFLHDPLGKGYVNDFAFHLLEITGLTLPHGRIVYQLHPLPFVMNGRRVNPTPNFLLCDGEDYILLLVETESHPPDREEPRLVAEAIGAFNSDNSRRSRAGLPPMPSKRYLGIVMIKSAPRLYKITITQTLVNAIETSQTRAEETIVERLIPPVPNLDMFFDEGMVPLENRYICLQCFEAMNALL